MKAEEIIKYNDEWMERSGYIVRRDGIWKH
jgi:hypothetical protein